MTTLVRESSITRPAITALSSSVLDHASVVTNSHFGLRNNEGLWPSYNCLDTLVPTPICPDPLAVNVKDFAFAEWVPGFEFAVYGAVQCKAVGLDKADQQAELARVFSLSEGKGVEKALLANRFVAFEESDLTYGWDAPTDLTPGSAVAPGVALALLEGYAASVYAGVPTIHMSRAVASLLYDRIKWDGNRAFTKLGAKLAIGGGYDSSAVPTGQWDMYATGEVYVERSEEIIANSYVLPGDGSGTGSGENGLADNTVVGLVERMYRVGVDCFVAKATASAQALTNGGF